VRVPVLSAAAGFNNIGRLSMGEVSDPPERVSEEAIRKVIRQCSHHAAAQGELSNEQVRRICEEVLGYRAADEKTHLRGVESDACANVAEPLHAGASSVEGQPRAAQCPEATGDAARLRAEDTLHRAFLTSILEYHDYTYDEVSPEVVRAIEQRAKALDAQLVVSVHTLETSEAVGSPTPNGSTGSV
jgi:hypothetical protein